MAEGGGMRGDGIKRSTRVSEGGGLISGGGMMKPMNPGSKEPPQNVEAGSGSRPTRSIYAIEDSMTGVDQKTLGRDVPGSLK